MTDTTVPASETVTVEMSQEVVNLLSAHLHDALLDANRGNLRLVDEPYVYGGLTSALRALPATELPTGDVGAADGFTDCEEAYVHETGEIDPGVLHA
jgi:hypothetical protein